MTGNDNNNKKTSSQQKKKKGKPTGTTTQSTENIPDQVSIEHTNSEEVTCQSLYTELITRVISLEKRSNELETKLTTTRNENLDLTNKVNELELQLDQMEQYSRRTCLIIDGIKPKQDENGKDLFDKVKKLTTNHVLNVNAADFDVNFDKI